MNILILGSGGREHSLAWAILQNPKCDQLIVAPGNAGIAKIATCYDLDICNGSDVTAFAQEHHIDFVLIGPEAPLVAGVADALRAAGILTFGPSQAAAELEASKAFTKEICMASNAPTAAYAHFSDLKAAQDYLNSQTAPIVIKADGLAAGKGVTVAMDMAEAQDALSALFEQSGAEVVIEEFMEGEEASFFILSDGETLLPIGTAQDHKRVGEGETGPNTGGMGAYSPAPIMSGDMIEKTMAKIIRPTMREMAQRGQPFEGVLFAGLMIKDGQPRLVEYNVRFGDPECQCLMMRLGGQILDLLLACAQKKLKEAQVSWANDHAMTIIYAANGYPGSYTKGSVIRGLEQHGGRAQQVTFHAGTRQDGDQIVAAGGRVLAVTARAGTLKQAHATAYTAINEIEWDDGFYRSDIGWRAL